ncbi:hypothetical protein GCM10023115_05770 [Pontixanthobacter gangjinensis]|uniref:DUF4143 domain-containing protein n=1 Tax=Pontixanthobacter gangjinensis TaxID=1028742 RepID=A0A6I4SKY5_9SPHN|nr:DUF4143 domain-containing protein [Pontixanthobacter gangjinensis]MXO55826.1 DUF4143 domain-containing protein [Pontixanthobacter gangjinensis]
MLEQGRGSNRPGPQRIEAWDWQPLEEISSPADTASQQPEPTLEVPQFALEDYWLRGGYRESLSASTDAISDAFLDSLIANELAPLPARTSRGAEIDRSQFLKDLARYNGCPLDSLWRKTGWDKASFDDVIEGLIDRQFIFRIKYLPMDDRSDLYYFCDTGVLHRLFNPKWKLSGQGQGHFANSWEGFVIRTILKRYGRRNGVDAEVFVWRRPTDGNDEIDLVLRWPSTDECWAIEIGVGRDKKPSKGFWVAACELGATDLRIIHRGICEVIGDYERVTLERFLTQY